MNFPLILLVLTVVTGVFWLLERFRFEPARKERARAAVNAFEAANREAIQRGEKKVLDAQNDLLARMSRQPWWLEYTAGLFPVIAIVFVVRSFLFEPFRIPSGSMLSTLHVGDFILVNKYDYGIRLPVAHTQVTDGTKPKTGDVVVFRYPLDPSMDYIKRVIGVPGDLVEYRDKVLYLNGVEQKQTPDGTFTDPETLMTLDQYVENLNGVEHKILKMKSRPSGIPMQYLKRIEPNCAYYDNGFACKVPAGHYFVMGDNRDNSEDSRFWGFMPEENLVGRAFFVWANLSDMTRVGSFN